MSVIRCKTCKNLFNTAKQESYCSAECRKEARKKVRKKWETKNPEYMKNYMRGYREKQPCKFSFIAVQNIKQIKSPLKGYDIIGVYFLNKKTAETTFGGFTIALFHPFIYKKTT